MYEPTYVLYKIISKNKAVYQLKWDSNHDSLEHAIAATDDYEWTEEEENSAWHSNHHWVYLITTPDHFSKGAIL